MMEGGREESTTPTNEGRASEGGVNGYQSIPAIIIPQPPYCKDQQDADLDDNQQRFTPHTFKAVLPSPPPNF